MLCVLIAILIREEEPKSLSVKGDEKQHCELAWKTVGRQIGGGGKGFCYIINIEN